MKISKRGSWNISKNSWNLWNFQKWKFHRPSLLRRGRISNHQYSCTVSCWRNMFICLLVSYAAGSRISLLLCCIYKQSRSQYVMFHGNKSGVAYRERSHRRDICLRWLLGLCMERCVSSPSACRARPRTILMDVGGFIERLWQRFSCHRDVNNNEAHIPLTPNLYDTVIIPNSLFAVRQAPFYSSVKRIMVR